MAFRPNRNAAKEIAKDDRLGKHLLAVAESAARDVRPPSPRIMAVGGARIFARQTEDYAEVVVKSSVFHWWEFGARDIPAQPYIRPAVQRALSKAGGRWKTQ